VVLLALVTALVISLAWGPLAIRWGPQLGYLDEPDDPELKAHVRPAVPLGGVGLFAAFHLGSLVGGVFDPPVFSALAILLVLGLADDRFGLSPSIRLGVEAAAGAVLGFGIGGGWQTSLAIALLALVAVNAVNLFDGLDGLAAGAGVVTSLGIAALSAARGEDAIAALILASAVLGFLRWNWHPARVFLGDNGAYVLGGLLAALIARGGSAPRELALGACLLGVYLLDLAVTVARRLIGRRPLFGGDRNHLYDLLHARGLSVAGVATFAASTQALFAVVIYLAE
jgi:UDP-GlcNAc:undecaprenyl-phosphate GlcNAc-1-phosphate transferase